MIPRRARLAFVAVLTLAGCNGKEHAPPLPPEVLDVEPGVEEGWLMAVAMARKGGPSPTPELDWQARLVSQLTPTLGLKELLGPVNAVLPPPVLRPGDQIQIDVLNQPQFSGLRTVSPDGRVDIPVLGQLPAAGQGTVELAQKLQDQLKRDLIKGEVNVSVRIAAMAQRSVKALGRVRAHTLRGQSGLATSVVALPADRPISVYGLLTLVQGLDEDADPSHLTLLRKAPESKAGAPAEGRVAYHFDFEALAQAHVQGLEAWLEPDDELLVPRLPDVYVFGAVVTPGRYPHRPGTTVAALLVRAGGARPDADERGTRLLQGGADALTALDVETSPGQVVFVPTRKRVYVVGRGVTRNGPLTLPSTGMTAVQAIGEAGWFTLDADQSGVEILRQQGDGKVARIPVPVPEILEGTVSDRDFGLRSGDTIYVPEAIW